MMHGESDDNDYDDKQNVWDEMKADWLASDCGKITESISLSFASFFSMVFCAASFLLSYSRVPDASSIIDRIYKKDKTLNRWLSSPPSAKTKSHTTEQHRNAAPSIKHTGKKKLVSEASPEMWKIPYR